MGVDVCRDNLLPLNVWVGDPMVGQFKAFQFSRFTGQFPVHLYSSLVEDFCEETQRIWN